MLTSMLMGSLSGGAMRCTFPVSVDQEKVVWCVSIRECERTQTSLPSSLTLHPVLTETVGKSGKEPRIRSSVLTWKTDTGFP